LYCGPQSSWTLICPSPPQFRLIEIQCHLHHVSELLMFSFNEMCEKHLHDLTQCSQPHGWLVIVNTSHYHPNLKLKYMTTHQKNGIINCMTYVCIGLRRVKSYSNASDLILNLTPSSEINEYTRTPCSHQLVCVTMCSEAYLLHNPILSHVCV
jgi:hypothetical protein